MSAELGLPLIRALHAFQDGGFATTVGTLAPLYRRLARIGGSSAQRNLFIQTLGIAAFKTGADEIAKSVLVDRRPRAPRLI